MLSIGATFAAAYQHYASVELPFANSAALTAMAHFDIAVILQTLTCFFISQLKSVTIFQKVMVFDYRRRKE